MARLKIAKPKLSMPKLGKSNAAPKAAPAPKADVGTSRKVLAGATIFCALGIGYVMQYGLPFVGQAATGPVVVDEITLTSSGVAMPKMPADREALGLPADLDLAAAEFGSVPQAMPPMNSEDGFAAAPVQPAAEPATTGFDCDITMEALPVAGAMVDVILSAPCNASERVTIHHNGMMFTEVMQPDGTLGLKVPALNEKALFMASFASGDGATASAEISSLSFYDRVVVQWKGEAGLQLHAREYDAAYFSEGHVWAADAGDLGNAARGEGGFLVRLGREEAPEALMAEVYSFPSGTAKRGGDVLLSVEAEVTEKNCGQVVEAQTLELHAADDLRVHDLELEMPGCDAAGDFLVLKNLVEDLTIAAR